MGESTITTPLLAASKHNKKDGPPPTILDRHSEPVTSPALTDVDAALRAFFSQAPGWLRRLLRIRNAIVSRLGFETGPSERTSLPQHFAVGEQIGTFTVLDRCDDEIVMGGSDQRFSLEISVWLPADEQRVQVTTRAYHNDRVGLGYLMVVRWPHALIAPLLVRRMATAEASAEESGERTQI